jgi:hypothetical protein
MEKFENFYLLEEDQVNHFGLYIVDMVHRAYILCVICTRP